MVFFPSSTPERQHSSTQDTSELFPRGFPITWKSLESRQPLPRASLTTQTQQTPVRIILCMILKVIRAGVGWVWLVRITFVHDTSLVLVCNEWPGYEASAILKVIHAGVCWVWLVRPALCVSSRERVVRSSHILPSPKFPSRYCNVLLGEYIG